MKKSFFLIVITAALIFNKAKAEGGDVIPFYYASLILSGTNIVTSIANENQIYDMNTLGIIHSKAWSIVGTSTGTIQLLLGAAFIIDGNPTGYINAGLGVLSICLSIDNLRISRMLKQEKISWNIKSIPFGNASMGICFSLKHNL
ncbi:MAG: hypothetical protein RIQ33_2003 [Bacteroidota bacterium]|jgi:hypothetical protein